MTYWTVATVNTVPMQHCHGHLQEEGNGGNLGFLGKHVAWVILFGKAKLHGSTHPFALFAVMMVLQLLWVLWFMPETKGVPLEEIQKKLGIE